MKQNQKIEVFMKKLLALCLAACLALSVFTACEDEHIDESTTTTGGTVETYPKSYEVKDGLLTSCIGQADENGVYVIPETVTAIAESAFSGDTRLKEVVIGSQVKMIGAGAFQGCKSLEKVTMAEGVEEIGSYAFYDCTSLVDVKIPSTVDYLNRYAFYGCTALQSIDLASVRYIDDGAFWYCSSLEKVTFAEELEHIGSWAFAQNSTLSETNLAELRNLETISDYAFTGCAMLLSVTIPEGVEHIGKLAFYDCTRLSDVKIANSVEMIDYAAFNFTPWFQENTEDYLVVGDGVLIKCNVHPNFIDLENKNIKVIGGTAFWNAESEGQAAEYGYRYAATLETVKIPETVTVIGNSAFAGCYYLKEITLPAGVTEIQDNAFNIYAENVEAVAKIDYSACKNLEYIGLYAFHGCRGIESLALPSSVETVGSYAFAGTKAYDGFMGKAAKAENEKDRYYVTGDGVLLAAYVANGQTEINVPDGVKTIAGSVFSGWDLAYIPETTSGLSDSGVSKYNISYHVKEVSLPDTLEVIGDTAFFRMLSVEKLTLPDSLRVIENDAFAFCTALASISGGSNVKYIGDYVFRYCMNIPAFQFSSNTEEIGQGVFMGCSSIKNVKLPKDLAFPGVELFDSECVSLTTLSVDHSARARIYTIMGGLAQDIKVIYYED